MTDNRLPDTTDPVDMVDDLEALVVVLDHDNEKVFAAAVRGALARLRASDDVHPTIRRRLDEYHAAAHTDEQDAIANELVLELPALLHLPGGGAA